MVAFLRVELAGSDDFGQLLHVGRFDVHNIKRLIRYLHMPKVNPANKGKFRLYYDELFCQIDTIAFSEYNSCLKQYRKKYTQS